MISVKRVACGKQLMRFFRTVTAMFKPGLRKTLETAPAAVSAVYGSFFGFPCPSDDFSIDEN